MTEKSNEQLVRALIGAAFHEGTLEHRDSPYYATLKKARDAVEQAKAAVLARMAGPGEVVVPKEPTDKMIDAAIKTAEHVADRDGEMYPLYSVSEVYAVMLAARPNNGGNDDAA